MLKLVISTLEEVDEGLRQFYVAKGDKFELKVEGVKTQADIDRLQTALTKERTDHAATKTELKTAKENLDAFAEVGTVDDVKSKLEKLETIEAAGNAPELTKNFETVVKQRVDSIVEGKVKAATTKLERTIAELTEAKTTAEGSVAQLQTQIQTREIGDAIRGAATTAKVIPESVADLVALGSGQFKLVDGKPQTEDGRTPEQWVEDRKKVSPYFWPAAKGAGGQGEGPGATKDNPFSKEGWNVTKQSQIAQADPAKADRLAKEAGVQVGAIAPAATKAA